MLESIVGKSAVSSKSVQGAVLAIIGGALGFLESSGKIPTGTSQDAAMSLSSLLGGLGGLWALIGAFTRKKAITSIL
jgi:hypothetical protein